MKQYKVDLQDGRLRGKPKFWAADTCTNTIPLSAKKGKRKKKRPSVPTALMNYSTRVIYPLIDFPVHQSKPFVKIISSKAREQEGYLQGIFVFEDVGLSSPILSGFYPPNQLLRYYYFVASMGWV